MYFATGIAKVLSTRDAGDEEKSRILGMCANNRRSHFCTWTDSVIAVWKIRVRHYFVFLSVSESPQPQVIYYSLLYFWLHFVEHKYPWMNMALMTSPYGHLMVPK